ncbi:PstS family phosphate ABC transporter substrate-binding protein [Schlesneria sp.]|uniref:PstS family phosphate ABC transporter substrate-binding protein n=1 Tax=Schlesneria sp. TaxID=2762018 RepID=UPI002EED9F07
MKYCQMSSRVIMTATLVVAMGLFAGCEIKKGSSTGDTNDSASSAGGTDSVTSAGDVKPATISAEGSSTVYPICQAFAVEFEKKATRNTVSVGRQGTGGGYKKFLNRQSDIWNASRTIAPSEEDDLKKKGINFIELPIAIDGIVIAVHPQNDWCTQLTIGQLKQVWEPDSQIKTWKDLNPDWPAEPMVLFGADTDSGTFEYFTEEVNGKKKATNTRYTPAADDNVLVQGISSNKYALGYIPFGYFVENTDKLTPVALSATKEATETPLPFVSPSVETILSGEYTPLSRPLYMYVSTESLKRPEVAEFLRFALSEESQPLIEKRGFVRLQDSARQKSIETLENALKEVSAGK